MSEANDCGSGLFKALLAYDNQADDPAVRAKRGVLCATLGFAEEAVEDLESAESAEYGKGAYWIEAQLGEAKRIYARDVIITTAARLPEFETFIAGCVAHFDRAQELFELQDKDAQRSQANVLAWIFAHRAACKALDYWGRSFSEEQEKESERVFASAVEDFTRAISVRPQYPWAQLMQAFLHTLRGKRASSKSSTQSDFQIAANLLRSVRASSLGSRDSPGENDVKASRGPGGSELAQSSYERNLAMLFAYEAAASINTTDGQCAAACSVEFALDAAMKDPSDYVSRYMAAASLGWLVEHAPQGEALFKGRLTAAVKAARAACKSTLSQATVALAGLALLEKNEAEASNILKYFDSDQVQVDIESAAILRHDPVFRGREKHQEPLRQLRRRMRAR